MEYKIKEDTMYHTKGRSYYCLIRNPAVSNVEKIVYGSTPEIVRRKIDRQLRKWELSAKSGEKKKPALEKPAR